MENTSSIFLLIINDSFFMGKKIEISGRNSEFSGKESFLSADLANKKCTAGTDMDIITKKRPRLDSWIVLNISITILRGY